jgi:hypothetical protein
MKKQAKAPKLEVGVLGPRHVVHLVIAGLFMLGSAYAVMRCLGIRGTIGGLLNRGNQRQPIFHDEQDYQTLMAALAAASWRYQLRIHAFCLMPNHFHLLAEVDLFPLSQAMRSLVHGTSAEREPS